MIIAKTMKGCCCYKLARAARGSLIAAACLTSLALVITLWTHSYRPTSAWIPYDVQRRVDPVTEREVSYTSYRGSLHVIVVTPPTQREAAPQSSSPHVEWKWLGFGYNRFRLETISLWSGEVLLPWPTQADRDAPIPGRHVRGSAAVENPRILTVISLPYWLICSIIAGGPAALWLSARTRRVRRRAAGRCVRCGYDLCASPDRCPECGHAAPHAGAQPAAALGSADLPQ
jgi:hypothetical protein